MWPEHHRCRVHCLCLRCVPTRHENDECRCPRPLETLSVSLVCCGWEMSNIGYYSRRTPAARTEIGYQCVCCGRQVSLIDEHSGPDGDTLIETDLSE